jgi:uncharacterized membrane protein SirB2
VDQLSWIEIAGVLFAIVFLVVGILRTVELSEVQMTRNQRRFAVLAHVLGTILFAAAIALVAIDTQQVEKSFTHAFFLFGLALLFPVHIFMALKRRKSH